MMAQPPRKIVPYACGWIVQNGVLAQSTWHCLPNFSQQIACFFTFQFACYAKLRVSNWFYFTEGKVVTGI